MGKHDDLCMVYWCSGFFSSLFFLSFSLAPRHGFLASTGVHYRSSSHSRSIVGQALRYGKCGPFNLCFHSMPMQNMVHSNQFYGTEYSVCRTSGVVDGKETQRQEELGIIGKFHQRASCLGNSCSTLRSPPALHEPRLGRSVVPSQRGLLSSVHTPDVAG
jgi:hypothetical protein